MKMTSVGSRSDVGVSQQIGFQKALKRMLDITVSVAGLLLGSPVLLGAALVVRLQMGAPVLFRQLRPGYRGKPFRLTKFRTMSQATEAHGQPLPDATRLTPVGGLLRASSIDELPQLWNVLVGDMSLVGPRPLLMEYLSRYSPDQARRHEVMPGITGWAQVNGRNALSWQEKFALDLWYVEHWSLSLDAKILAMTVVKVLRRAGISRDGHATMPEFRGNPTTETKGDKE
jgi:sugar transferase EpsL